MKIEIEKRDNIPFQIEDYILKRVKKLEKYIGEKGSMRCVISQEKGNFSVEIILENLGNTFKSHASSNDIKLSVNKGLEKLKHQFKRFKERIIDRRRQ